MPDVDAFETAYDRLAFARLAGVARVPDRMAAPADRDAPSAAHDTPRSRLLPRLALMAPGRSRPTLR